MINNCGRTEDKTKHKNTTELSIEWKWCLRVCVATVIGNEFNFADRFNFLDCHSIRFYVLAPANCSLCRGRYSQLKTNCNNANNIAESVPIKTDNISKDVLRSYAA